MEMEIAKEGGEMREIRIIYFLRRTGRVELPHLICVDHPSRNAVYLRDVKRRLAVLRGQDMPESFYWSCKRKYKTSNIWQDLLDDDLISPSSDDENEYVLQGSEISSIFDSEKKASTEKHLKKCGGQEKQIQPSKDNQESIETETTSLLSTQPSSEITEEQSPRFSTDHSTDDSTTKPEQQVKPARTAINNTEKKGVRGSVPPPLNKSRTQSSGGEASSMFQKMITCGNVDTNDSIMVKMNRSCKPDPPNKSKTNKSMNKDSSDKAKICKGDKLQGGSARIFGTSDWNHQPYNTARKSWDGATSSKKYDSGSANQKADVPAAYKPVTNPSCSQCGKTFRPEKMHTHMKSCSGMRALAKSAAAANHNNLEKTSSQRSMNLPKHSFPPYFLTRD